MPPRAARPSRISILARQMPSREPRNSMCEVPIIVMTARLGWPQAAMEAISPKADMPISKTAASVFSSMRKAVSGIPTVLL